MRSTKNNQSESPLPLKAGTGLLLLSLATACGPDAGSRAREQYIKDRDSASALLVGQESLQQQQALIDKLFRQNEYSMYARAVAGSGPASFEEFEKKTWTPYLNQVTTHLQSLSKENPNESIGLRLKKAIFQVLGDDVRYNQEDNSLLSPLIDNRLQCRSGTHLYLLTAQALLDSDSLEGSRLVIGYTDTHAFPAMLDRKGELVSYEMTLSEAEDNLGLLTKITTPMRVCDAGLLRGYTVFGDSFPVDKSEMVLLDTLPPDAKSSGISPSMDSHKVPAYDPFSFSTGQVQVPEGNLTIPPDDTRATSRYDQGSSVFPGSTLSGQFSREALRAEIAWQQELHQKMTKLQQEDPQNYRLLQKYLSHNELFGRYWDNHAQIFNSDLLSKSQKLTQLDALIDDMSSYYNAEIASYAGEAVAIMQNRDIPIREYPGHTYNAIVHNRDLLASRRGR